jgi:galactokinase
VSPRRLLRTTQRLADVEALVADLRQLAERPIPEAVAFFDTAREIVVTRAPGRLDVMGGIADYSGSLVLEWPLREATLVALQRDPDRRLRIESPGYDGSRRAAAFEIALDELAPLGRPLPYEAAKDLFRRDPAHAWAAYVCGVFVVLMRERGVAFREGARLLVRSSVPEGKGVASSAALEVAVMKAVVDAFAIDLDARDLALLCQKVENLVVGAPCGIMDQMTAACGRAGALLALLCQPAELLGSVALPADLQVIGLDSGRGHAVAGAEYTRVRVGTFMGARILAELAGLAVEEGLPEEPVRVADTRWGGYLANLKPSELESFADRLPDSMAGAEFLERYRGTTDTVARVDPARTYPVRMPTGHAVHEHFRVRAFAELLTPPATERRRELLGELMYQSHASYSACGLGSKETDDLVALVRAAGPARGFFGAKTTGGGSGGTVAVLARRGADVSQVADDYAHRTGYRPHVFSGSSPGAAAFGHLRLTAPAARRRAARHKSPPRGAASRPDAHHGPKEDNP